jgi:hypothetical protein
MTTKAEALRQAGSCLNKARADEPIFVLRASDPIAAQVIRLWCAAAQDRHEPEKVANAHAIADFFEQWFHGNVPQCAAQEVPQPTRYQTESGLLQRSYRG